MANVKNNTTVCALNINCLSQDGALNKNILVRGGFPHDMVAGLVDIDRDSRNIHIEMTKVKLEDGKLAYKPNCRGQEKAVKEVKATAGIPPKFLNASHNASRVTSCHGYNGTGMGMSKY